MAVRAIIGFEHLPQGNVNWINFADHGITRNADQSVTNTIVNGWLQSNSTSNGSERVNIPLANYITLPVNKIWCGVRIRIDNNTNSAAGIIYYGADYMFILSDLPTAVNGTIAYLEFSYNIVTGVAERWINGVALSNKTLQAGQRSAIFGLEAKGTTPNRIAWRDIYICDDQLGSTGLPVGPLGPQVVTPITLDTAAGPDWTTTPSSSTLLNAISEPGAVPTTNIATSAVTKGLLTASLHPNVPAGSTVIAIELTVGLSAVSGSAVNCSTALKNGANQLAGNTVNGPLGSYNYAGVVGVFHKNPAGAAWDNASIDATDFILTPDV